MRKTKEDGSIIGGIINGGILGFVQRVLAWCHLHDQFELSMCLDISMVCLFLGWLSSSLLCRANVLNVFWEADVLYVEFCLRFFMGCLAVLSSSDVWLGSFWWCSSNFRWLLWVLVFSFVLCIMSCVRLLWWFLFGVFSGWSW